jgi:hypothetical protein
MPPTFSGMIAFRWEWEGDFRFQRPDFSRGGYGSEFVSKRSGVTPAREGIVYWEGEPPGEPRTASRAALFPSSPLPLFPSAPRGGIMKDHK